VGRLSNRRQGISLVFFLSFLSVLTCAIGVLMLLLVLLHARRPADAAAVDGEREELEAELAGLERRLADLLPAIHGNEQRTAGAQAASSQRLSELARERERLARAVSELRKLAAQEEKLRREVAALRASASQLTGAGGAAPRKAEQAELEAELARLDQLLAALSEEARQDRSAADSAAGAAKEKRDQVERARERIDALRAELDKTKLDAEKLRQDVDVLTARKNELLKQKEANKRRGPLLLPGADGGGLQPVFVECRGEGVVIHPDQQIHPTATLAQADSPFGRFLDRVRKSKSQYVLFVVRPLGFDTFYTAQEAAEKAGVKMGWEPLPADIPLELPTSEGNVS
jgi:hypothetical protein